MLKIGLTAVVMAVNILTNLHGADGQNAFGDAVIRKESGQIDEVTVDGKKAFRLSGVTPELKSTKYFVFSLGLKTPVDLRDKQVRVKLTTTTSGIIVAVVARFYNRGESKPCWSFFNWGVPFKSGGFLEATLRAGKGTGLPWDPKVVSGGEAATVDRIQFWVGTAQNMVPMDMTVGEPVVEKIGPESSSYPPPKWSDKPAAVAHPSGIFKPEDIERGRENLKRYPWAQDQLAMLRKNSALWMNMTDKDIDLWIPADDAWFKCLCPKCFTQPEYAWKELTPDGKLICANCKQVFPSAQFPEDHQYTVITPHGKTRVVKYYKGPDQMTHEENLGPKYHLSGELNYMRLRNINKIYGMACVYALTGEKPYAEKIRAMLLRFAEVYPDYLVKFRATSYRSPEEQYMAGKLCAWKYHDSYTIINLAVAYDLTFSSGLYSPADQVKIENGIFREYRWLITAHPPTRDWCLNAVPAHMSAGAICGVMLGDHDLIGWALEGEHGLRSFTEKYYHRDGFWYEDSPSYAVMANTPLCQLADILNGYSDPPSYRGRDRYEKLDVFSAVPRLEAIFSAMVPTIMPDGNQPAVNDSTFACRLPRQWLQFLASHRKNPENLAMLQYAARISEANTPWNVYAVFKNPPEVGDTASALPKKVTGAVIMVGPRWAILRRPENPAGAALLDFGGGANSGHFHNSTLNLIYYDWKKELLTDLGYLAWQHPLRPWLISPLAHNLVVVDGKLQSKERGGEAIFWSGRGPVCGVTATATNCYPGLTEVYRRTVLNIALPDGRQYLADFFRVRGGRKQVYAFHADGEQFAVPDGIAFAPFAATTLGDVATGSGWLKNARAGKSQNGTLGFRWKNAEGITTVMHLLNRPERQIVIAEAPGLRDRKDPFAKTRLNLLFCQADGPENTFAGVIEAARQKELIAEVTPLTPVPSGTAVAIAVKHQGGTDLIVVAQGQQGDIGLKEYPQFKLRGQYGVVRIGRGQPGFLWMGEAESLRWEKKVLPGIPSISGRIVAVDPAARRLTVEPRLPEGVALNGCYLLATGQADGAYRLEKGDGNQLQLDPRETVKLKVGDRYTIPLSYIMDIAGI